MIWYFLWISTVVSLCVFLAVRRSRQVQIQPTLTIDTLLAGLVFGLIGARLFHIVIEEPGHYFESPLRVFALGQGGFVWYGGLLVGASASVVLLQRRQFPVLRWTDAMAPIAALGYGLGRLACWIQGCCYGVCLLSSDTAACAHGRYPTQLFAVGWELAVAAMLWRSSGWKRGVWTGLWLALHGLGRIIMEQHRADPRGLPIAGLSVGTWLSAALLVLGLVLIWRARQSRDSSHQLR
jgi:phosphatidylglycerol:prolipoprotein diacylglycerol transferase